MLCLSRLAPVYRPEHWEKTGKGAAAAIFTVHLGNKGKVWCYFRKKKDLHLVLQTILHISGQRTGHNQLLDFDAHCRKRFPAVAVELLQGVVDARKKPGCMEKMPASRPLNDEGRVYFILVKADFRT